jgi:hypothetical protein
LGCDLRHAIDLLQLEHNRKIYKSLETEIEYRSIISLISFTNKKLGYSITTNIFSISSIKQPFPHSPSTSYSPQCHLNKSQHGPLGRVFLSTIFKPRIR